MLYITLASFAIHRWIAIENFWYGVNFSPWYAAQIIGADAWECHSNLWTSSRMLLLFLLPCFPPSSSHNMHKFEFVQIPILAPKKTHTHTHTHCHVCSWACARSSVAFSQFLPELDALIRVHMTTLISDTCIHPCFFSRSIVFYPDFAETNVLLLSHGKPFIVRESIHRRLSRIVRNRHK